MCRCPPFLVFSDELEQLESLTAAPHASENMYEVEHGWFVQRGHETCLVGGFAFMRP